MTEDSGTAIIYADAPVISDTGLLTHLSLLYDKVLLIGRRSFDEHLEEFWGESNEEDPIVIRKFHRELREEGVLSFLTFEEAALRYPQLQELELTGISDVQEVDIRGKQLIVVNGEPDELDAVSTFALSKTPVSVRELLRLITVAATSHVSQIPVVSTGTHEELAPARNPVASAAGMLSHRTLERLAIRELRAYRAEDVLEARLSLRDELLGFRAGVLELLWLVHQKADIAGDQAAFQQECDILIETRIAAALMRLETAIASHRNRQVRRIIVTASAAMLELGKALITPGISNLLMGGSAALLEVGEVMDSKPPTAEIASFLYRIRERAP